MTEVTKYLEEGLDIEVRNILSYEDSLNLANYILANAKFRSSHYNKDGTLSKRRNKII